MTDAEAFEAMDEALLDTYSAHHQTACTCAVGTDCKWVRFRLALASRFWQAARQCIG